MTPTAPVLHRVVVPALVGILAAATLSACGIQGLNFVQDDRVEIVAPKNNATVTLPLTVRWTARDFDGSFAVLVDRAPPNPGKSLATLAEGDAVCEATPGCPDAAYLAGLRAYTTTDTSFEITQLPELTEDRTREGHEVTIVLLDPAGKRIGESAFRVDFNIRRKVR